MRSSFRSTLRPHAAQLLGYFLGVVAFERKDGHLAKCFVAQTVEHAATVFGDHAGQFGRRLFAQHLADALVLVLAVVDAAKDRFAADGAAAALVGKVTAASAGIPCGR